MTPYDSCAVYEQSYAIHIWTIRSFLPGAAGCKSVVTVSQTADYIKVNTYYSTEPQSEAGL